MAFKKLRYEKLSSEKMQSNSSAFLSEIKSRRTVRDFSDKKFSIEIIYNCIKAAASSPSGANKQPWHFVVVQDKGIKKQIRIAAEKEEKEFYAHRATKEWLQDLNQFGTDWRKPFLEIAPYLIVVFRKKYDVGKKGNKKKELLCKRICRNSFWNFTGSIALFWPCNFDAHPKSNEFFGGNTTKT